MKRPTRYTNGKILLTVRHLTLMSLFGAALSFAGTCSPLVAPLLLGTFRPLWLGRPATSPPPETSSRSRTASPLSPRIRPPSSSSSKNASCPSFTGQRRLLREEHVNLFQAINADNTFWTLQMFLVSGYFNVMVLRALMISFFIRAFT